MGEEKKIRKSVVAAIAVGIIVFIGFIIAPLSTRVMLVKFTDIFKNMFKEQNIVFEKFTVFLSENKPEQAVEMLDDSIRKDSKNGIRVLAGEFSKIGAPEYAYLYTGSYSFAKKESTLIYWVDYKEVAVLIQAVVVKTDNGYKVSGFNAKRAPYKYADSFRFPVKGVPVWYFGLFLLALYLIYFTTDTAVMCLNSDVKRKWLWLIFIYAGLTNFRVDWVESAVKSPDVIFQPLAMNFMSAGIVKTPDSFWDLGISIPLGAIIFRAYLKKRKEKQIKEAIAAAAQTEEKAEIK